MKNKKGNRMFKLQVFSILSFIIGTSTLLLGCAQSPTFRFENKEAALTVQHPALYPETIEYNKSTDKFLLGSFREGAIYEVDQTGNASLLVNDSRLCSVLGIAIDAPRKRLWAVNSDLDSSVKPSRVGPKKLAGVGIYDLSTGKPINYVDLSLLADGPHLVNGIALDSNGNAFVTDSFSPIIYKITPEGEASIFLNDEHFAGNAINLNGLIVHPDGYLIVIKKSDGTLYKIPLERPTTFSKVALDQTLIGGDGLTLVSNNTLIVIANRTPEHSSNAAYSLSSDDSWVTAKVDAMQELGDAYPTTAVFRNDILYVLQSKLNQLIASPHEQKTQLKERATIRPIGRLK
jgi:sugar lactone lactonase YvrE